MIATSVLRGIMTDYPLFRAASVARDFAPINRTRLSGQT